MELIFLRNIIGNTNQSQKPLCNSIKGLWRDHLFDCGEGTQRQMTRARVSPMKISKIFITHFHGDHFLGIPGIIQSMAFRGRTEPLHIYGPSGLKKLVDNIKNLGYFALTFEIKAHEVSDGTVLNEEDYLIKCCKTEHSVPNLAYSINEIRAPKFIKENALELWCETRTRFW